jgi:concanavalin A-like lectin/glucanase superfamily protein
MAAWHGAWAITRRTVALAACGSSLAVVLSAGAAQAAGAAMVAQWRFDESDGQTVFDDGPFGLAGRLGAADGPDAADPARIAGAAGGALRFDGSSFVRLPDAPQLALQSLSIEAFARAPQSPGHWRYIVSRGGQGCYSGAYGLYTGADGGVALYVFDGSRYVVSAAARSGDVWDGGWHHIAGTFDGRALRMYIDGRPVGEPMAARLRINYSTTSVHASIGQYAGDCDLAFRGDLDLVRLSSEALSADAIAAAARGDTPSGDPLPPAGSRNPLPAAAPGTALPGPPSGSSGTGAPAQGCRVQLSRTRIASGRRSVVRAQVVRPGPHRVDVVANRTRRGKTLAKARTGATGLARLVLRVARSGRLTISVKDRPACSPAYLTVSRHH